MTLFGYGVVITALLTVDFYRKNIFAGWINRIPVVGEWLVRILKFVLLNEPFVVRWVVYIVVIGVGIILGWNWLVSLTSFVLVGNLLGTVLTWTYNRVRPAPR